MRARLHLPRGVHYYRDAIEGLVRVNADLYREDPHLPSILDPSAGVRYRGYDPGEDWRNVLEVLRERYGDCEDLAAARAGELRARGDAGAYADIRRTGPEMTHAFVVRGNGTIEDPSRALGMGAHRDRTGGIAMSDYDYPGYDGLGGMYRATPRRRPVKRAPIQVGPRSIIPVTATTLRATPAEPYPAPGVPSRAAAPDPFPREDPEPQFGDDDRDWGSQDSGEDDFGDEDNDSSWAPSDDDFEEMGADPAPSQELSFAVNRTPTGGWQGIVKIPFLDGRALTVARTAPTKPAASASALSTASNVLNNPLVKALIPPQAAAALAVIQSPVAQKAAAVAFQAAKKLKFW